MEMDLLYAPGTGSCLRLRLRVAIALLAVFVGFVGICIDKY